MMYRVVSVVSAAHLRSPRVRRRRTGCLDGLKPGPSVDTVRFESEPPGAEAKTSNGQTCRTPCALALPVDAPLTVTFTLNGYQPVSETLEPVDQTGSPPQLRPNPVMVELTPAPPPPKPSRQAARKPAREAGRQARRRGRPRLLPAHRARSGPCRRTGAQSAASAPWPAPPRSSNDATVPP